LTWEGSQTTEHEKEDMFCIPKEKPIHYNYVSYKDELSLRKEKWLRRLLFYWKKHTDVFHFKNTVINTARHVVRLWVDERPPAWRVAVNTLNKQLWTANSEWSSILGVG
jgi:hypothetical protein